MCALSILNVGLKLDLAVLSLLFSSKNLKVILCSLFQDCANDSAFHSWYCTQLEAHRSNKGSLVISLAQTTSNYNTSGLLLA